MEERRTSFAVTAPPMRRILAGPQRVLVVPVRFPDATPQRGMQQIAGKVRRVAEWVRQASYGKASIEATILDWQPLPRPLAMYRVSQYNFQVDRDGRLRLVVTTPERMSLAGWSRR